MTHSKGIMLLVPDDPKSVTKPQAQKARATTPSPLPQSGPSLSGLGRLLHLLWPRTRAKQQRALPSNAPSSAANGTTSHHVLQRLAPNTGVTYDPQLIEGLKDDHERLLQLYGSCVIATEARQFDRIGGALMDFRSLFNQHVVTENIRFYLYLIGLTREGSSEYKFLVSKRKEMGTIQRAVSDFIKTWVAEDGTSLVNDSNLRTFKEQLVVTGKALVERVQMEESVLYTLYMPT